MWCGRNADAVMISRRRGVAAGSQTLRDQLAAADCRARNGFGGMVVQRLYGKIDDNCNISGVEDDQQIADEFKHQ